MALGIPGRIGGNGSSSPSTLAQYLASIGKDSWYARYIASSGLAPNSDGSGGAVADGGAVGCWAPIEQVGFNHKFIQATAASRPLYSTSLSAAGPTVSGNGSSWFLGLSSTTALNLDLTVLVSCVQTAAAGVLFFHGTNYWGMYSAANTGLFVTYESSAVTNGLIRATESEPTGTANVIRHRLALCSGANTARYNTAPRLFASLTNSLYGSHQISEIALVPKLTRQECSLALQYLV